MSKPLVNKLIQETLKEFAETSKRVSPRLIYLAKLAKHYRTFEEFENDYQIKNFHGIYWHLTTNPNFVINPKQSPTDLSSLAGRGDGQPGLMVSTDIGNWHDTFDQRRQYAVQIDLSDLIPNVDYRDVKRGFGHEIYVFKPEGAKVVKILPISKALKQNYNDYHRTLPQNQEQLRRLYDLAHQKDIQENSLPDVNNDRITREDEYIAIQFIKEKYKNYFGPEIGKHIKKIRHEPSGILYKYGDEIHYDIKVGNRRNLFVITKYKGELLLFRYLEGERSHQEYHNITTTNNPSHIDEILQKEEIGNQFYISKEEEQQALQYIKKFKIRAETIGKSLRKVRHLRVPNRADVIDYMTGDKFTAYPYLVRIIKSSDGQIYVSYPKLMVNDRPEEVDIPFAHYRKLSIINENHQPLNLHISKEEENQGLQFIRKEILPEVMEQYNDGRMRSITNDNLPLIRWGPDEESIRKSLRKVSVDSERIIYKANWKYQTFLFIIKKIKGNIWAGYINLLREAILYDIRFELSNTKNPGMEIEKLNAVLKENKESLNLHISKEEEQIALQKLRKRKNNQGELIGKYLKKIKHHESDDPKYPDQIVFLNTDDSTTYTLQKDRWGELGYRAGYINPSPMYASDATEYTSNTIDSLDIPIHENAPTGDWQSWGVITQPEKDRLKIVLDGYIRHIRNIYHPHLAEPKAYLIKKAIDNLDVSDPRFSAKPLAKLSMEDRLSLGDFVDHADTEGTSSKVMNFLLNISREYIQPPKSPEPDIILDKIARVVWPSGTRMSDVTIHGLDDMRPIIGFGHGGYSLTDNFIKQYSKPGAELYIDLGADVKVTNMPEVMKAVKQALERDRITIHESQQADINSPQNINKMEEDKALEYIKNLWYEGQKVGKTLKKYLDEHNPDGTHTIGYSARLPSGPAIFKIIKQRNKPIEIHTGWGSKIKTFPQISLSETFDPKSVWGKKIEISKVEEDRAFEWLKRGVVNGVSLGKTLKKSYVIPSTEPNTSDIIIFTGEVHGKPIIYRLYKGLRRGLEVRDASPGGDFKTMRIPMEEAAISSYRINHQTESSAISKKEEDLAFEFLKNQVVDGERLGKTLRKTNVIKSSKWSVSDIIVYKATVKGENKIYRLVKEVDEGIIKLRIEDITPGSSFKFWLVPT